MALKMAGEGGRSVGQKVAEGCWAAGVRSGEVSGTEG